MNCSEIRKRLSAFHDGHLPTTDVDRMRRHLATCDDCAADLVAFEEMSALIAQADCPEPAEDLWDGIAAHLTSGRPANRPEPATATLREPHTRRSTNRRPRRSIITAIAAAVVVIASATLWHTANYDEHDHLVVDFDQYLTEFTEDPAIAARRLFAQYDHEAVNATEAARRVGYQPVAAGPLPENLSVQSIHVLKMPCCTCVKTLCRDGRGRPLTIFEHDAEQPVWFGDRPSVQRRCSGRSTRIIEFDNQMAATWRIGKRHVTIIGARDLEQVINLVAHLTPSAAV